MRHNNSVGGYRLYPSSPDVAESAGRLRAIIGRFNEGMDRLSRECELTQIQQQLVNNLDSNCQLARYTQSLRNLSQRLWQLALEKQQEHNLGGDNGIYSTDELGMRLNNCANRWQELKRLLDELA